MSWPYNYVEKASHSLQVNAGRSTLSRRMNLSDRLDRSCDQRVAADLSHSPQPGAQVPWPGWDMGKMSLGQPLADALYL